MSEWRVTRDPQEKAPLRGRRAVQQPATSRGRRLGSRHRVGGEGRLLSAVSAEGGGAEEAGPGSGRPKFVEGTFFAQVSNYFCDSCFHAHHPDGHTEQVELDQLDSAVAVVQVIVVFSSLRNSKHIQK